MACPYCEASIVRYSDQRWLHYIRSISMSKKRYCPSCDSKWIVRKRTPTSFGRELLMVGIATVAGLVIFYGVKLSYKRIQTFQKEAVSGQQEDLKELKQKFKQENPELVASMSAEDKKMIKQMLNR